MSIKIFSVIVKMLNDVKAPSEYMEFVRREVPLHIPPEGHEHAYRMCKLAYAASRLSSYEFLNNKNPLFFRRAIESMCGTDGNLKIIENGTMYRIVNLRISANIVSDNDIAYIVEAFEMTMAYANNGE